jgi:PTS system nitrogen regulatory IIA component
MSPIVKDVQADVILPDLKASSSRQVMQILAAEASLHEAIDAENLYEDLLKKEQHTTSGIGGGVAILHLQVDGLYEPFLMMARLQNSVDFNAVDRQPVDLVVLLVSPEADGPVHLRRLSRISRVFKNDKFCAELRGAKDAHGMRAQMMLPDNWQIAA